MASLRVGMCHGSVYFENIFAQISVSVQNCDGFCSCCNCSGLRIHPFLFFWAWILVFVRNKIFLPGFWIKEQNFNGAFGYN